MKLKYCFNCKQAKVTGSCMVYFCEPLQRNVMAYSVDKDCPLQDSGEEKGSRH